MHTTVGGLLISICVEYGMNGLYTNTEGWTIQGFYYFTENPPKLHIPDSVLLTSVSSNYELQTEINIENDFYKIQVEV